MRIIWLLLMVLLGILGFVLVLALLLLLVPFCVSVDYADRRLTVRAQPLMRATLLTLTAETLQDQLIVRLKLLFIQFTLFPKEEKPPRRAKKKKPPGESQKKAKPAEKPPRKLGLSEIQSLLSDVGEFGRRILAALRFRDIAVFVPISAEDAYDTAMLYGNTSAAVSALLGVANNLLDMQFDEFILEPDFTGELRGQTRFFCRVYALGISMLAAAVCLLLRLMKEDIF